MENMSDGLVDEAQELAQANLTREKFNFSEMIRNRTFPEVEVPVYVDEALAFELSQLNDETDALDRKVSRSSTDGLANDAQVAEYDRIESLREDITKRLNETCYTATVRGIDDAHRQRLLDKAFEEFPPEFETKTTSTGRTEQVEIENPERGTYFVDLVWQACIREFVAPDGAKSEEMSPEDIRELRGSLPKTTRAHLDRAIEKVQMSADWYKGLVDEVF